MRIPGYRFAMHQLDNLAAAMSWRGIRRFIVEHLDSMSPTGIILNVGSGGRVARVMQPIQARLGLNMISLDIDPARDPDIVADIITYASDVKFDAIFMIEVLEHVERPHDAITNIYDLLKPGGRLILTTPFLFPIHDRPCDYFRFTRYGLRLLLKKYRVIALKERDGWAQNLCVLLARMFRETSIGARIFAPFGVVLAACFYPLAIAFSHLVKSDAYASGYTVVAQKVQD